MLSQEPQARVPTVTCPAPGYHCPHSAVFSCFLTCNPSPPMPPYGDAKAMLAVSLPHFWNLVPGLIHSEPMFIEQESKYKGFE